MSLFDVIKYPVEDWRRLEQLVVIPIEILRLWAGDCLTNISKDFDPETLDRMDALSLHMAITAALFNSCRDQEGYLDNRMIDIYCYYFTRMLRKRIKDA